MKIKKLYMAIGVLLLSAAAVRAQQVLPLTLDECRARALAHSEELQQAGNRLEQARLDRQIASAASLASIAFFTFSISFRRSRGRPRGPMLPPIST